MDRWSADDLLALVWGAAGLVVSGYLLSLAVGSGGTSWPLVGFALVALVGFSTVAVRHRRAANAARAQRESGPVGGWRPEPAPEPAPEPVVEPGPDAGSVPVGQARAVPPALSDQGRAELTRVVEVLDRAGLFRPRAPQPDDLVEAVADAGEPVTTSSVLSALWEGEYYHPDFDPDDHLAALAFHDSHTEQLDETLREQVADLARLTGAPMTIEHLEISGRRTELTLAVVGTVLPLTWESHPKYLSTVLHVAVARALPEVALAWTWADQGVWVAVPRTALRELNAELGQAGEWTRVADEEPMAAGELLRPDD